MTNIAFDTNILVYAEGLQRDPDDTEKIAKSRHLIASAVADNGTFTLSGQVLLELYNVLVRKARLPRHEVLQRVNLLRGKALLIPTDGNVVIAALELASRHELQIFDAVILAAAAEARCDVLMSEDLQPGFAWRGVTVVNPFEIARP